MNKVAAVTIFFWIMKILATTLGETAGDFISMSLNLGYYIAFAVTFVILIVLLFVQIKTDRYRPILYWTAIIATTTAGTEVSDLMDRFTCILFANFSLNFSYIFSWGSLNIYPEFETTNYRKTNCIRTGCCG